MSKSNAIEENYISIDEAAEYIGIKTVTLRNWIKKKPDIPAHRVGKQSGRDRRCSSPSGRGNCKLLYDKYYR